MIVIEQYIAYYLCNFWCGLCLAHIAQDVGPILKVNADLKGNKKKQYSTAMEAVTLQSLLALVGRLSGGGLSADGSNQRMFPGCPEEDIWI